MKNVSLLLLLLLLLSGCSGSSNETENGSHPPLETMSLSAFQTVIQVKESNGTTILDELGTSDDYFVVLSRQPKRDVIVHMSPDTQSVTKTDQLVFTPDNWKIPQRVEVFAVDDMVAEGSHRTIVTHTAGSEDPYFNGIRVPRVVGTIYDNDFTISGSVSGAVVENVDIMLSGSMMDSTVTNASGEFSFTVNTGSYLVTPSCNGYDFAPEVIPVDVDEESVNGLYFESTIIMPLEASIGFKGIGRKYIEGEAQPDISVQLRTNQPLPTEITFSVIIGKGSTCTPGLDYVDAVPQEYTFPIGSTDNTSISIPLICIDDDDPESLETLDFRLHCENPEQIGYANTFVVEMYDNDGSGFYAINKEGVGNGNSALVQIDRETGATYRRSAMGISGIGTIGCLAYDQISELLYFVALGTNELMVMDLTSGCHHIIAPVPFKNIESMTFISGSDPKLCAYDNSTKKLVFLSPDNGEVQSAQNLVPGYDLDGLAYVPSIDKVYGVSHGVGIYQIDYHTGQATSVNSSIRGNGLAYNPTEDCLIVVDAASSGTSTIIKYDYLTLESVDLGNIPYDHLYCSEYIPQIDRFMCVNSNADAISAHFLLVDVETMECNYYQVIEPNVYALEYNPNTDTFFAIDDFSDILLQIDRYTGRADYIANIGKTYVSSFAYDSNHDVLYGCNTTSIFRINYRTGTTDTFSANGNITGLAYDKNTDVLYGASGNSSFLNVYEINTTTGAISTVFNAPGIGTLFDITIGEDNHNLTGMISTSSGKALVSIDLDTSSIEMLSEFQLLGLACLSWVEPEIIYCSGYRTFSKYDLIDHSLTSVGGTQFREIRALEWQNEEGKLYGIDSLSRTMFSLNKLTGEFTYIGGLPTYALYYGLAYDSTTNLFFTVNAQTNELVRINIQPWTVSVVGVTLAQNFRDLTFDRYNSILYGTSLNDGLMTIDKNTGVAASIGQSGFSDVSGLALDNDSGILYGQGKITYPLYPRTLLTIDATTGSGNLLAPTTYSGLLVLCNDR